MQHIQKLCPSSYLEKSWRIPWLGCVERYCSGTMKGRGGEGLERCNTLQHTATCNNTQWHIATHWTLLQRYCSGTRGERGGGGWSCVFACVCVHARAHACVSVYVCARACTHVCVHVHTCASACACMCFVYVLWVHCISYLPPCLIADTKRMTKRSPP